MIESAFTSSKITVILLNVFQGQTKETIAIVMVLILSFEVDWLLNLTVYI